MHAFPRCFPAKKTGLQSTPYFPRALALSALLAMLTGCVVSDQGPPPVVYEGPPQGGDEVVYTDPGAPEGDVVITSDSDFYGPLEPYGEWVEVDGYGRCWRPRNVDRDWRPYTNGQWRRTDSGWYWESDESWGWATSHYGRWNEDSRNGWYWVPDTHWAPAWVSWREGGGYTGWAPLPPRRRAGVTVDVEIAPRSFVYVEERHFSERVRPTTVIVNNTTIINKTVNINQTRITNNTVINGGPHTEVIERATGRKVSVTPVREVRRVEEKKVVVKPPTQPRVNPADRREKAKTPPGPQPHRDTRPPPDQPPPPVQPQAVSPAGRQPMPPPVAPDQVRRERDRDREAPPPPAPEKRETPPQPQLITGPRGSQAPNTVQPKEATNPAPAPKEVVAKPTQPPPPNQRDLKKEKTPPPKKAPPKKDAPEKVAPEKEPPAAKDKPDEQKEKAQQ
jgi:hypothetical protein